MPGNSCRSRKRTSNEGRITTNHASKVSCVAWPSRPASGHPAASATPHHRGQRSHESGGAQRRPARWGRQPPDPPTKTGARALRRSTKAGPVGPATPNFTRSIVRVSSRAQRRPARWGRQPDDVAERPFRLDARSTKAGPVGPATRPNRRPGARAGGRRSTKAGPVGPATPSQLSPISQVRSTLNEGRPGGAGNP